MLNKDVFDNPVLGKPNERPFNPNISIADNNERDLGAELGVAPAINTSQRQICNSIIYEFIRDNNHYAGNITQSIVLGVMFCWQLTASNGGQQGI